jgi:hypothetical protein
VVAVGPRGAAARSRRPSAMYDPSTSDAHAGDMTRGARSGIAWSCPRRPGAGGFLRP